MVVYLMCLYVPHGPVLYKNRLNHHKFLAPLSLSFHLMYPNVVWLMECDKCLGKDNKLWSWHWLFVVVNVFFYVVNFFFGGGGVYFRRMYDVVNQKMKGLGFYGLFRSHVWNTCSKTWRLRLKEKGHVTEGFCHPYHDSMVFL